MGKSMLLLSGFLVVVGNWVIMLNCPDSEPLSSSGQAVPTQEVFKSGWDLNSAATVCSKDNMVSEVLARVANIY